MKVDVTQSQTNKKQLNLFTNEMMANMQINMTDIRQYLHQTSWF